MPYLVVTFASDAKRANIIPSSYSSNGLSPAEYLLPESTTRAASNNVARQHPCRVALVDAFSFGGQNLALLLGRYQEADTPDPDWSTRRTAIGRIGDIDELV